MAATKLPNDITSEEFQTALDQYDQIIEAVSASKGAKPGQKTLSELDSYRYTDAPNRFSLNQASQPMRLQDVQSLVEWKLKHGKFRPTLMKLVASNEASFTENTIRDAVGLYKKNLDATAAVDTLVKLKGIGPATASLLLAVHDPENVIFFADEAFYWLCSGGRQAPIKYNAKEYKELNTKSQALARRLNVEAIDVERVAYVLMNGTKSDGQTEAHPAHSKDIPEVKKTAPTKRKQANSLEEAPGPRRSKRGKHV
ncbi:hypothetical protein N0V93_001769 [Gnomoniopsis smithogilvyi]|uniref:Uncharacterized protein n=1 Tax=Gnomoniopsis smithogilvyi TaxID=1191159 RepID=A0A9W8Z4K8_9PEZI|nr:hypothetical protein N0V93_001769 [Gnomoniopsis smithogilvyi]